MSVKAPACNTADCATVKSMDEIGHSPGMKTIAEHGVISDNLCEAGADPVRGYRIVKPIRIGDLV
ncbi:hypothetical protein ACWJKU_02920 [Methylocaldum sp. MU1018]